MESSDFLAGKVLPVDPELIDRELSRLWKPDDAAKGSVSRACLSNLIFHLPDDAARVAVGDILTAIGRRFPSRVLLLTERRGAVGLSAWVTAVCHLPSPGVPPVCCEQITLEAPAGAPELLPGAVMPLVVPDVPVILVLLFPGGERLSSLLGGLGDRIILDSRRRPVSALGLLRALLGEGRPLLDDLAWRDVLPWRRVICDIFDEGSMRPLLDSLRSVEIDFRPAERDSRLAASEVRSAERNSRPAEGVKAPPSAMPGAVPAALLGGWLVSRLGWIVASSDVSAEGIRARLVRGREELRVFLRPGEAGDPAAGGAILGVRLSDGGHALLGVTLGEDQRALRIEHSTRESCILPRRIPLRRESDASLLGSALERITDQRVLAGAVSAAMGLVSGAEG